MRELILALVVAAALGGSLLAISAEVALDLLVPSPERIAGTFLKDVAAGRHAVARERLAEAVRAEWPHDRLRDLRARLADLRETPRLTRRAEDAEQAVYDVRADARRGTVSLVRSARSREWRITSADLQ